MHIVMPRTGARSWKIEVVFLAAFYLAYTGLRLAITGDRGAAFGNADDLLALQATVHLDVEQAINGFVSARPYLALPLCFGYATLHDLATIAVLVWLWRCHPAAYGRARTGLMIACALALLGFWLYPLAPPRMLPGFTDTMIAYAEHGWWGGGGTPTNEFAAMPSLHAGWAFWCGWQLLRYGRARWTMGLGIGYPLLVVFIVVGTANHYLLDIVAGAAVVACGLLAAGLMESAARVPGHRAAAPAASSASPS